MAAKQQLINPNGQPTYGVYPDSVDHINYMDFDLRSPMDRKLSSLAKRFKFNQFQFIGLISESRSSNGGGDGAAKQATL